MNKFIVEQCLPHCIGNICRRLKSVVMQNNSLSTIPKIRKSQIQTYITFSTTIFSTISILILLFNTSIDHFTYSDNLNFTKNKIITKNINDISAGSYDFNHNFVVKNLLNFNQQCIGFIDKISGILGLIVSISMLNNLLFFTFLNNHHHKFSIFAILIFFLVQILPEVQSLGK